MTLNLRLLAAFAIAFLCAASSRDALAQEVASSSELSPAQMEVIHYAYGVFPQQLAAIERDIAFAEYEAALWQQRVNAFRPTRSFGVYGATYHADQFAQLQAFAAQQRAECLRQQAANLWRERHATVAALMSVTASP
jgi:hypothetical protein